MVGNRQRRVVITGMGVVAPNGIGKEAFWQATSKGISGIKPISRTPEWTLPLPYPIKVAGEVSNFVAQEYIERKLAGRTDRVTHFAFAAVHEALQDAGLILSNENPHRVGAVIANTIGGAEYVLQQIHALYTRGPRFMSAYTAIAWLQVANVGQMSIRYGIQGYCKTPVNDTVGGLDALGLAYNAIHRGIADVIIAGGCEAPLHPYILHVMAQSGHYTLSNDPHAYRPFDQRADGFFPAEGAGICIVEDLEHARQRGATIYGEIVGYGQSNDAHGHLGASANGTQYARAMRIALESGEVEPHDIGYFSLDGRAIPASDQSEAEAIQLAFGSRAAEIAVSVPRTTYGHAYAAAGALDAITAIQALEHALIPPTIHCDELDPRYELNMVRQEARPLTGSAALIGGRSIGGANVVLAVRKINNEE